METASTGGKVGSRAHPVPDLVEVAPQVGFELLDRLPIRAGRTPIGFDRFVCFVHSPLIDLKRLVCRIRCRHPVSSCSNKYDSLTRPLRSSSITSLPRYYGSVRPSAPRWYSRLAVFAAWASPLASERLVPAVPRKSLHPLHAPSTPVAVCPVIRHLTDLSQKGYTLLVLTTFASLRRVFEGFTFVRLSDAHLHEIDPALLPQRSPPRLLTAAAWSGLRPAPESRSRRVDEGVAPPHPSQIRMCRFPASGSSWESLARGGVDDTIRDSLTKKVSKVVRRFRSCQFSYPLSFRGQVCETQSSHPCFPPTALSAWHPSFLDRVPVSPVPRCHRYY